eukprot:1142528-Pelagomonas_calceolata.AAC.3
MRFLARIFLRTPDHFYTIRAMFSLTRNENAVTKAAWQPCCTIIFSEDAMTSSTGGIPDNGSTWTAAPGLNLVLAALLSMLALLS